ncbi:MAG TPA: alginate lyase family protein, partial [Kofleriaceae bacterium]|nr:alginate lyase family protein [Kofleriaceae bacterium]
MPPDVCWYLDRLQAMSLAEVAHRSFRAARYPVDQLRMRMGVYARPSSAMRAHIAQWRGPEPFYFDRALISTPLSPELREEIDAICAGRRRVLGLGWIDFPRDGWHYEPSARSYWPRIDAGRVVAAAPEHFDPRLTWEMNRGHEWVVLARCFAATHEPRFLDQLVRELASWRQANPVGIGINWTSAMEAAIRVHSLVWCAGFLRGTAAVLPTLGEMIYEHAIFIADHRSYFSSANNHLLVELSALIVAALALGGELASLHEPALARLRSELERQVFPDGVNAEMATHYHVFVLEALLLVAYLLRAHSMLSPDLCAVIKRMADYVAAIRCDDGALLQQGDNDDGCILAFLRTRHADQLLAAAAALSAGSRSRERTRSAMLEGAFWMTGGTRSSQFESPPPRSRHFAHGGQVVLRSRRLLATLDAGPFGFGSLAAHAHCDALSISVAIDGRRLVVDRGTYRYNGDLRERDRFRLTAAHNTAQVGTLEQAAPAGAFLWSRQPRCTIERCELTDHGDLVQATHDGFPGWVYRRTLLHQHGVLAIIDELEGQGAADRAFSRYHFAPELVVTTLSGSVSHVERGGAAVAWLFSGATSARVIESPHSDTYAASTPAPTLELSSTSECPLMLVIASADAPLV